MLHFAHSLLRRLFPHDAHHVAGMHDALAAAMPPAGRALDLGCGANTDLAPYRTPDREVWGTDFEAHPALQHAAWFRPLAADGSIPFPAGHFDLIVSVMVLEHVERPEAFFREVARALRPGGRFIAHTISGLHYTTWARRLVGLLPHSFNQRLVRRLYGRECVDTFPAFYRLNSARQLARSSGAAGLQLAEVRRYADPGYFRFFTPLMTLAVLADRAMEAFGPGLGRLYLTAVLTKPAEAGEARRAA